MASLGAKNEKVNAQAILWKISGDQYILLTRKRFSYRRPQRRFPTGAGNLFYSMLPDNRIAVQVAYTTGEVGTSVPAAFDEMVKANATTKEVPENTFTFTATDTQGTPASNVWTMAAKCTLMEVEAGPEGESVVNLEFQITDENPAVT